MSLGEYPAVGLAEARKRAERYRGQVSDGKDPQAVLQAARRAATVSEIISRFLVEEVEPKKKPTTLTLYAHYLRNHVEPALGSKRAQTVTRSDVAKLHRDIGVDTPPTANRVIVILSGVYNFAGKQGLVPEGFNPARGIEKFREQARERYLTTEELGRLGNTLRTGEIDGLPWLEWETAQRSRKARKPKNRKTVLSPHVAAAFRLLLFTGCRLREILHLRWSEVDFERGLLLLSDSKTGRKPVIVNAPALEVLNRLSRMGDFVILGERADKPRADLQRPWELIRAHAGLEGLRVHDLRHTHASIGAGAGLGLPIIGRLLGHRHAETTARYAHLDVDPLRHASNSIASSIAVALGDHEPSSEVVPMKERNWMRPATRSRR